MVHNKFYLCYYRLKSTYVLDIKPIKSKMFLSSEEFEKNLPEIKLFEQCFLATQPYSWET